MSKDNHRSLNRRLAFLRLAQERDAVRGVPLHVKGGHALTKDVLRLRDEGLIRLVRLHRPSFFSKGMMVTRAQITEAGREFLNRRS
jgi:hypothetical protein